MKIMGRGKSIILLMKRGKERGRGVSTLSMHKRNSRFFFGCKKIHLPNVEGTVTLWKPLCGLFRISVAIRNILFFVGR